jgi:phospholipid transport system substrate-binding protein
MLRRFIFILALLVTLPAVTDAWAASAADARRFADEVGKKALAIVNGGSSEAQLQELFAEHVDIPWMGQFVLGAAWQQATPDQRQRYMQAYKDYLMARYTTNFSEYSGSKYKITDVRDAGDGQFLVRMDVDTPQQSQDVQTGYRLRDVGNGQFKISDIIIEGVSLITTQRSEFASVVQKSSIEALIADLASKSAAAKHS